MSHVTDYGNIKLGDRVFIDVPLEKDIFDKTISSENQICEITRLRQCGAKSVWVTFASTNGYVFAQLKRITSKVLVYG